MKRTAVHVSVFLGVIALSIVFGCNNGMNSPYGGGSTTTPAKSSTNTVTIVNFVFSPSTLTVTKGTVVTWQNNDGVAHTATSDNGKWDTGSIPSGGSKSISFDSAGTFAYHCTVHPMMTGTVAAQ